MASSAVARTQADLYAVGIALHGLAYRLYRLPLGVAVDLTLPERAALAKEVAVAAVACADELTKRADRCFEKSRLTLEECKAQWEATGRSQWRVLPGAPHVTIFVTVDSGPAEGIPAAQEVLFDAGLETHRLARRLYFMARRFELFVKFSEEFDHSDFQAQEPKQEHLEWFIGESCDGGHRDLWHVANRLIAASKAHNPSPGCQWHPADSDYDENRMLM